MGELIISGPNLSLERLPSLCGIETIVTDVGAEEDIMPPLSFFECIQSLTDAQKVTCLDLGSAPPPLEPIIALFPHVNHLEIFDDTQVNLSNFPRIKTISMLMKFIAFPSNFALEHVSTLILGTWMSLEDTTRNFN